jgi:hypothetical protein
MKKAIKKEKKIKLTPLPKLRRKLLKLWSENVREKNNFTCAFCGTQKGDINKFNPELKSRVDAHHLLQKEIKDCPLKYEIKNGISLCPSCHKFNGEHSAHKSPIVFYNWFREKYPNEYDFILKNSNIRVDLDNRKILEHILKCLENKESLNLQELKDIEKEFPRLPKESKQEIKLVGNLFEEEESSSSSGE